MLKIENFNNEKHEDYPLSKLKINRNPINKIIELGSKRGLRNSQVQDIHPILVEFSQMYAKK